MCAFRPRLVPGLPGCPVAATAHSLHKAFCGDAPLLYFHRRQAQVVADLGTPNRGLHRRPFRAEVGRISLTAAVRGRPGRAILDVEAALYLSLWRQLLKERRSASMEPPVPCS